MTQPTDRDAELSRAVVCYTRRGVARSPRADADAVIAEFGAERGSALAVEVTELFREADSLAPAIPPLPLAEAGDEVARIMAERHPELTAEAISAIRWKWTFDWR